MEKHIEVMRRINELFETCEEALNHIHLQLESGYFEQALPLFSDVFTAIFEIEKSISPFSKQLSFNHLEEYYSPLKDAMEDVIKSYENSRFEEINITLSKKIMPHFQGLKENILTNIRPYILS